MVDHWTLRQRTSGRLEHSLPHRCAAKEDGDSRVPRGRRLVTSDVEVIRPEGGPTRRPIAALVSRGRYGPEPRKWHVIVLEGMPTGSRKPPTTFCWESTEEPAACCLVAVHTSVEDVLTIRSRCRHVMLKTPPAGCRRLPSRQKAWMPSPRCLQLTHLRAMLVVPARWHVMRAHVIADETSCRSRPA